MKPLNIIDWLALFVVIVGSLNWGLVGLINFNGIAYLCSSVPFLARIIYILMAIGAIYLIVMARLLVKRG